MMKRILTIVLLICLPFFSWAQGNKDNDRLNKALEKAVFEATGERVEITGGGNDEIQMQLDEVFQLAKDGKISQQQMFEMQRAIIENAKFDKTKVRLLTKAEVRKLSPEQQIAYGKQLLDDMEQINKKRESKQEAEGIKLNSSLSDLLGFNIDNYYKSQKQNRFFTPDRLKKQPTEKMALQINTILSNAKGETMTSSGMERTKESINHTKEVVQQIDDMAEADLQRDKDALGILQMVCDKCGK